MGEIQPLDLSELGHQATLHRRRESESVSEQLAEIARLAGQSEIHDHEIIRMWCGLLPPDDSLYETIVNTFEDLTVGKRVLYPELLHGGVLGEGKHASLVPDTNPRTTSLYSLRFILPIKEQDNSTKTKPLPVPYKKIVTGDDVIADRLIEILRAPDQNIITKNLREPFQVEKYLHVARTIRALGWDISKIDKGAATGRLNSQYRDYVNSATRSWVENAGMMPRAPMVGLLELGDVLETDYVKVALAEHVATTLEIDDTSLSIGQKGIAAFTSYRQRNGGGANFTRAAALAGLRHIENQADDR